MRLLIAGGGTGGHLMSALAIAARVREVTSDVEPVLVGAERGVEASVLPSRDFRYHLLPTLPLYRAQWWKNLAWPLLLPRLLVGLRRLFEAERPAAVLGTGGYASAPVVWGGLRRRIPVALQEQNAFPGMVTRRFAGRADHLYLGLPEAGRHLAPSPTARVLVTGNPILPPDKTRRASARQRFGLDGGREGLTLLATGGSQGALALNRAVASWLDAGADPGVDLIWVTGRRTYAAFASYHRPPSVTVVDFLDPMADGYAAADLVVARAGALTVAELCAWGLPSILVPLPSAAAGHQAHNAAAMVEAGAAVSLAEGDLDGPRLGSSIRELVTTTARREAMSQAALERGRPDAAAEIVSNLLTLVDRVGFPKS